MDCLHYSFSIPFGSSIIFVFLRRRAFLGGWGIDKLTDLDITISGNIWKQGHRQAVCTYHCWLLKFEKWKILVAPTPGKFQNKEQNIDVTTSVAFIDVTRPALDYYAEFPVLKVRLPYDFFYPFVTKTTSQGTHSPKPCFIAVYVFATIMTSCSVLSHTTKLVDQCSYW